MLRAGYWQRISRRRWPRRTFLKGAGALAVGAAGVSAVGCSGGNGGGPTPQSTGPATEGTPRPGHRLQIPVEANFISIDPHLTVGTGIVIDAWVYSYLFRTSCSGTRQRRWSNLTT
jgi:hypothetical protein